MNFSIRSFFSIKLLISFSELSFIISNKINYQKEEITSKSNELKILTSALTDDELKARIKELKKELAKMKVKVDDIKENKIDPSPPEKMNEAKNNFEKELKVFKKTKKICTEIINDISDGLELKLRDTYEKIGIENDDELPYDGK